MIQIHFTEENKLFTPLKVVMSDGTEHLADTTAPSKINMIDFPTILGDHVGEEFELHVNDNLDQICTLLEVGTRKDAVYFIRHS